MRRFVYGFVLSLLFFVGGSAASVLCQAYPYARMGANLPQIMRDYLNSQSSTDNWYGSSAAMRLALVRKSLTDFQRAGLTHARVATTNFRVPELQQWATDPTTYFAAVDLMMDDFAARNIKIVPSFFWHIWQYVWYTKGTLHDQLTNPSSTISLLFYRHVNEFVTRYKNHSAILFWELGNEVNLQANLDLDTRGAANNAAQSAPLTGHNFTTDELMTFQTAFVAYVKAIDPVHPVTSGHGMTPTYAEHLRATPEWSGGGDFTADTQAQFIKNLTDVNTAFDVVQVHFYNTSSANQRFGITGNANAGLLDIVKATSDSMRKHLFVGEFGDGNPTIAVDPTGLFTQAVIAKIQSLQIPYAQPWAWEFYYNGPTEPFAFNLEPGITDTLNALLTAFNTTFGASPPSPSSPDTVAPAVVLTYPFDNATIAATQTLYAQASDDSGTVTKVEFYVDGVLVNTDAAAPYTYSYNSSSLSSGAHTVAAKAYDPTGNTATYTVTVTK